VNLFTWKAFSLNENFSLKGILDYSEKIAKSKQRH